MKFKTFSPTPADIKREWWVVDAQGQTLGRLATKIAEVLRGKHKPTFAPHMDMGDFVIVINADKIHVTGRRLDQKLYYRHSGYPGGLRSLTLRQMMEKHPERAIQFAVRGMLPKNRLGRAMFKKLKVYAGDTHPHEAQSPKPFEYKI
jgi:large subunit ribosomal protein L13